MAVNVSSIMERALRLADRGTVLWPNPRVGCVITSPDGATLGEGWHQGGGTPHAEVEAISDAHARGNDTRGATAVVTLEPCKHTGATGPCTQALLDAGISQVVYALGDPSPTAGGGAALLRAAGVQVTGPESLDPAQTQAAFDLVRHWYTSVTLGRPYVTLKMATTLDGRVAATDSTSKWISCPDSRDQSLQARSQFDAIIVTTGTVLADDPQLSARTIDGSPRSAAHQPLRVIVGLRNIPDDAKVFAQPPGHVLHLRTHDIAEVLAALNEREFRHVLIEGGPAVATAALQAGVVDEVHAYISPVILGTGSSAVGDFGVTTIAQAPRWQTVDIRRYDQDVLLIAQRNNLGGDHPFALSAPNKQPH
ncbi:MAG: bifunctional diaminohydroxyphosphoribosylaminopyrimidine deaminase/5-amino-6-(5-phosphoribosylamino)uracil reductase RibD [Cellulomonadaceae bacterium]|jgi:diaminohydroxyphosphoribosylaminopyrimidine deaminase/5-amino-6-(5-phosphoribosylamino)uracil reductase|nr:bifunctional diaminohydroxyphosphoribosylaminopyrimidine deaminase/5-amino-6-(5-phosphoribosylamino)uracil reductase RibD [Cellulomonadaceae bacterium]